MLGNCPDPRGLLAVIVVYLGMPLQLVGMLAQYGLGYLSVVYKEAIRSKLHFESVFAGTLARSLAMRQAYGQMLDGSKGPMSKQVLDGHIKEMFKCGEGQTTIVDSDAEVASVRRILTKACETVMMDRVQKGVTPPAYDKLYERDFVDVAINADISTLRTVKAALKVLY